MYHGHLNGGMNPFSAVSGLGAGGPVGGPCDGPILAVDEGPAWTRPMSNTSFGRDWTPGHKAGLAIPPSPLTQIYSG